uniref:Uncharacterized protein n=1 Tax=Panagrolaimus superbus TaxID=310955 RepID=A0A914Y8N9_9BILA
MDSSYRRSRSQSRFPPIDEHPGGYPTGQPLDNSHRSKSLDNRRDFVPEDDYDPYRSIERNSTFHASLGGQRQPRRDPYDNQNQRNGGGDFFNETITIPSAHTKSNSKFDSRHEGADDDWTSYDRQVRYHTERTAYPNRAPPPSQLYYDNYGYRNQIQAPPQELSPRSAISRYPESELYERRYDRNYQQQQNQDYRNENDARMRGHGHFSAEGYGDEEEYLTKQSNIGGINRGIMNESAGAAAAVTSGRGAVGAAAGGGGGGHYRYHHESHSHGGGGGASGGKAHYGQTNGYSQNAFSQHREKRSGGGFFSGGRSKKGLQAGPPGMEPRERVYHRIHCCCFSFKWPPFAYEECEPPRPMYLTQPPKGSPMPSRHTLPPPPPPQY